MAITYEPPAKIVPQRKLQLSITNAPHTRCDSEIYKLSAVFEQNKQSRVARTRKYEPKYENSLKCLRALAKFPTRQVWWQK